MRLFLAAFQFLTIIPFPFSIRCDSDDLGKSTAFFPTAGLLLGALLAGVNWVAAPLVSRGLCDAILITVLTLITGALHLDGLADVCDGLAARGNRERFLEVMKDSRVGAVGVVGIVLGILLKWQALVAVPETLKYQSLLLFLPLARFSQVLMMAGSSHARNDGLGKAFIQSMGAPQLLCAAVTSAAFAALLMPFQGFVAMSVVTVSTLAIRHYFVRRLGGITGDIVGFSSELAEIGAITVFSSTMTLPLYH